MLRTRNIEAEPIRLDSIDVDFDFLEGFDVLSIEPAPSGTTDIIGQQSWSFTETVGPGEEFNVTYRLKARRPGHYVGDIDVCNPNQDWTTVVPNIDVVAE